MKSQLSRRYLYILFGVCSLFALSLIFQAFVLKFFVQPLALAFWAAWRVLLSINQEVYWSGLIITGLLLALRLAPTRGKAVSRYQYEEHPEPVPAVEKWHRMLTAAPFDASDSLEVKENLRRMFTSLAVQHDKDEREAPGSWKDDLPPELSAFLYPLHSKPGRRFHLWENLVMALPFMTRLLGERPAKAFYDQVEQALKYIEIEMENQDDNSQNG